MELSGVAAGQRVGPPTIADVAAHAGVGAATVSRVLNAHPNVADPTRERVLAAIRELNYRPSSVARNLFIGSPSMNLVPAGLIEGAGSSGMLAGFRPEHVEQANGRADGARFDAVIEVVEYLGDEQLVHLRLKDTPLLAKLDIEQRIFPGEQSTFRVPQDKLHLFDAETEQALRT